MESILNFIQDDNFVYMARIIIAFCVGLAVDIK